MMKRLNDIFDNWNNPSEGGGIFSYLNDLGVPWMNDNIQSSLDLDYHGNHSGDKIISNLLYRLDRGDLLSKTAIAQTIFDIYILNWDKQYAVYEMEYNPIQNYDMTESGTDSGSVTRSNTATRTDNLTHTKTGTEGNTGTGTGSATNSTHGFNAESWQPSDKTENTASSSNTTTYNTTDSDTGTVQNTGSGSDTTSGSHSLRRSGNIGVTTSQQMIQSEIDLWKWNFFHDVVFPDLDYILTLPIY